MADKSDGKVRIRIEDNIQEAKNRLDGYENKVNNFDVSGLQGSMDNLNKVIAGLSDKFMDFSKPLEQNKTALSEFENVVKSQQSEIEKLRKSYSDLGNKLKKQADITKTAQTAYGEYENKIRENIQVMRELAIAGDKDKESFKKLADETKKYKDVLKQADDAVNKATGSIQKQTNHIDGLTSKLKGLVGAYVGIRGAQMAFNGVMQSVEAYRVQERAILSLDTTLKNAGVYSAEYSQKIQNLASEIQSYSNYGDEAVIKAVALGQAFAGQTKITDKATKAVVDFAAATGMDLEQAFSLFGKSVGTSTNALSRYGVELKKGMTDQQKMEAIAKQLGDRYTGQAAQMANASVQLKNAMGDLSEAIGRLFNPAVENSQRKILGWVNKMTDAINHVRILKSEISSLDLTDIEERLKLTSNYIAELQSGTYIKGYGPVTDKNDPLMQKYLKEQEQLIARYKQIKAAKDEALKPIKYNDEISNVSVGGAKQKIKDQYEKLTENVQKARRQVELMAVAHGTDSQQVQNAFIKYRDLNNQLSSINSLFDSQKQKIEAQGGAYQQLNEKVAELKTKLLDLAAGGQSDTEIFANLKTEYEAGMQELENVNKTFQQNFEQGFKGISNSIYGSLSNAILTPLSEGETAIQRLGNIGLNITKQIADTAIQALLQEITLEKTKLAIKSAGNLFGGGGGFLSKIFGSAKGNVFKNGNIKAFETGGVVSQPTYFPMAGGNMGLMGEAGAEAVMPLKRTKNGDLGVQAQVQAANVNIYNYSDSRIETRKRPNGDTDIFIRRVNAALSSERTQKGFSSALQRNNNTGVQAS